MEKIIRYYYGQAVRGMHSVYGSDYGVLDGIAGCEDKTLILEWNSKLRFNTESDTDKITEFEFMQLLPEHQRSRKATRLIASYTRFAEVVVVYEHINRDMYNFTINTLIHGVPVWWIPKYAGEMNVKDFIKFDTYRSLLERSEFEHTYDCDFPKYHGTKLPYPTIKCRSLSKASIDTIKAKLNPTILDTLIANVKAAGFKLPDDLDKEYYKYEVSKSFLFTLRKIVPKHMLTADNTVSPAYAYFVAKHFEAYMDRYVQDNAQLTEARQNHRDAVISSIVRLNPTLESYEIVLHSLPDAESLEVDFKTNHFILLDYVDKSEMFFGPTKLNKEFAAKGEATLYQMPNQLGMRTSWDYRDYAHNAERSGYEPDGASYLKALDSMAENKSSYVKDVIDLEAEQVKLRAARMLEKMLINKIEFLSDGYRACKHCGTIYKLSDFELTELSATDDPEYRLYGDWSEGSYNDTVTGDDEVEPVEFNITSNKNPLEEHLCEECQGHLTMKMLLNLVDPETSKAAKKLLRKGVDKTKVAKALIQTI